MKWLFISPEFPPSNKTGGIRPSKFAKYFNHDGEMVEVITYESEGIYHVDIDTRIKINKVSRKKIPFINDEGANFLLFNFLHTLKLMKHKKFDVVFVSVPVFLPMIIAYAGKKLYGQDYCLDYRDLWRADPYLTTSFKDRLLRYIAKFIEPIVMRNARIVTFVSHSMMADQRREYPAYTENFKVISTGYDEEDMIFLNEIDEQAYLEKYGSYISHVGMLDPNMNVKDIVSLLSDEAVQKYLEENNLKFLFVGAKKNTIYENIPLILIEKYCNVLGTVSRSEALKINKFSYMSLVLGSDSPQRLNRKVFELLRLSKRIFYIGNKNSETAKVLRKCDVKTVYSSSDDLASLFCDALYCKEITEISDNLNYYNKSNLVKEYLNKLNATYI